MPLCYAGLYVDATRHRYAVTLKALLRYYAPLLRHVTLDAASYALLY